MMSCLMALALVALPLSAAKDKKETDRLDNCGTVIKEVMDIPDNIPLDLVDKAECIIVFPSVLKAAFVIGGSYGRGAMTCRSGEHFTGPWSAPTMMALEGGSIGFQLGGQATDFVLLVMNPRGARAILSNKVKLGADASAAAGPKGRDASASTDVSLRACRWKDQRFARTTTPMSAFMARRSMQNPLSSRVPSPFLPPLRN